MAGGKHQSPPFEPPGWRCYIHPNRKTPRKFTAKDAARVMCYAKAGGASQTEILDEAKKRCWTIETECEEELNRIKARLAVVAAAIIALLIWLSLSRTILLRITNALLRLIPARILRKIGFGKILDRLEKLGDEFLEQIGQAKEARDLLERILRGD